MARSLSETRSQTSADADAKTSRRSPGGDAEEIERVVRGHLAGQHEGPFAIFDETIVKSVARILTSFGIFDEDRKEMRADFQHLRRWRKSMEEAKSSTLKAIITLIVAGFVGAVWLGVKTMFGK
jgi:hypothetical protein